MPNSFRKAREPRVLLALVLVEVSGDEQRETK